jgi:5-formyltetrahydrofolate cyclo-ligase
MTMAYEKTYLRAILKTARQTMPAALAAELSREVQSRLLESGLFDAFPTIVLYAAVGNEVSTDALMRRAASSAKSVLLARLRAGSAELELARVRDFAGLVPGAFGIPEPPPGAEVVAPEALGRCLVVAPGVAFSVRGERLGRGGGHYDRLLAKLDSQAITVGLAYSFQLLDSVPQSGHDRRLGFVITESAVYPSIHAPRPDGSIWNQGGTTR